MGLGTTDQKRQEYTGHQQGFEFDLMTGGDVLLSNREGPGNTATLGGSGEHLRFVSGVFERTSLRR